MTTARAPIAFDARDRISRIVAAVSLCIGAGLIVGGGYAMHRLHLDEFVLHPVAADGVVVRNQAVTGRGTTYAAIVTFTDATGRAVTFRDPMAFGRPSFAEGQKVKVFYDPSLPGSAMVDRHMKNYVVPAICLAFAGFCVLGGLQRFASRRPR